MAEQSNKVSPKPFIRKSEIMDSSAKSRSVSTSGSNGHKIKTEIPHNSKITVGALASDAAPKTYLTKCYEDQQVKLKLLELTPRNPAKETSEGVQEFIKQVSNFIEKKNPFKDKVKPSCGRTERTVDSVKFNKTNENLENSQKFRFLRQTTFDINNESVGDDDDDNNNNNYLEKLKWEKPNSAASLKRNSERIPQGKKNRSGISVRKKDQGDKKNQKELTPKSKKNAELKRVITLNENPIFYYENGRNSSHEKKNGETSTNKRNQTKKKKPSEIPLSKNRKPVSMLPQKPLEDIESTLSINLVSNEKSFSPVEDHSFCSEIQVIISAIDSSEKLSESGKISEYELDQKKIFDECSFEKIKLSKYFKSPDVMTDFNSLPTKLSEDLFPIDKKIKVLDLEKMKTASFTVLRSSTDVLSRLESLHKQNISTKEEKIAAKTTSKPKILSPENSFTSVKEKGLIKNLSFRLSSKGNKPNLKIKGRKNKKETEETFHLLKKRSRISNNTKLEISSEIITTGNTCPVSRTFVLDSPKNETSKANQNRERTNRESDSTIPVTIRKPEGKSIPRRTGTLKEKEELKIYSNPAPVLLKANTEVFPKLEKVELMRNSTYNKKSEKGSHRNGNPDDKQKEIIFGLNSSKVMPRTPPPTPDVCLSISETSGFENIQLEDDEISSKTIILDNKFNQENNSSWCSNEFETRKKPMKTKSNMQMQVEECKSKESLEITKIKKLVIKGRSLSFGKDEPPEKPESSDSSKVKMQLKTDFNKAETAEDNIKNPATFDWLFMNHNKCNGELIRQRTNWDNLVNEDVKERNIKFNYNSIDSIASELTDEKVRNKTFDSVFRKPRKCCSSLKRRIQYKTSSVSVKGMKKKKVTSDTENRRLPPSRALFNSDLSPQNKNKVDTKLNGGLGEDNQRDLFEDVASVKLKRRNSEPQSFKGFIWKCTDFGNSKGVRPSASSLNSSLRHLNTDDIDDFIFWEPVPQKMTSCWEMSLYHFKKPWTVPSCSVFKDNRQSKTPGLIFENLRNRGNVNIRQSPTSRNERTKCHKENPFDVEPSIAQKNIDIRNWLAALNFPTPPTTSNDVISEGYFSVQSTVDAHNLNKIEAGQKRRKILPNIKFSDETSEKEIESKEKYKSSTSWEGNKEGPLMELIRRKSGGFVTKEQFLTTEHLVPCRNVTVNFCICSKSAEDKFEKTNDGNGTTSESKISKSLKAQVQFGVLQSETIGTNSVRTNQSVGTDEMKEELPEAVQKRKKFCVEKWLRLNFKLFASQAKVWTFLFMFTLFITIVYYSFLSSSNNKSNL